MSADRMVQGRLLFHPSGEPAWNMSVDQAIAESVTTSQVSGNPAGPVLRFYTWRVPTLSLGYFQSNRASLPRFADVARVRRSTGGGAILHHHELTYSLIVPSAIGEHGARVDLYQVVHDAFIKTLSHWSVNATPYRITKTGERKRSLNDHDFLCFRRRTAEDLVVSGYKVMGSAQRRFRGSLLQHGSLLLRASSHANELPGVKDLTSSEIIVQDCVRSAANEIASGIGTTFSTGDLSEHEHARADMICTERFANDAWWLRR